MPGGGKRGFTFISQVTPAQKRGNEKVASEVEGEKENCQGTPNHAKRVPEQEGVSNLD